MAYEASDTGKLVRVMSDLYVGAKGLVMVDGGITEEERELADQLFLAMELAIRANNDTKNISAVARGQWRSAWFERRNNDLEKEIARLKARHEAWIASLEPGDRIYIPFGHQRMTARECESQTA